MKVLRYFVLCIVCISIYACSSDEDEIVPRNLSEYIDTVTVSNEEPIIAYAGNAEERDDLTYIYYYPEEGATNIRYYEATGTDIDKNDLINYRRLLLNEEEVFGDQIKRFLRSNDTSEAYCLVTYFLDGKLKISSPIRIKSTTKPTIYTTDLEISYPSMLNPVFNWTNNDTTDNDEYFQAIYNVEADETLSGTYTTDQTFIYYNTANVIRNLNAETLDELEADVEYEIAVLGIDTEDNWINFITEEAFVPQNLSEYLEINTVNNSQQITAFGVGLNESLDDTYIYFYPTENARDFRFYETESLEDDALDLTNYRRKILDNSTDFGAQLRRFTRESDKEVWGIVTYEVDGEIYQSAPIEILIGSNQTTYETDVEVSNAESLLPAFSWSDFATENTKYLAILTENDDTFVSGFFTNTNSYQYKNDAGVIDTITNEELPDLILDDTYNITVYGFTEHNWANLIIQSSFEAK